MSEKKVNLGLLIGGIALIIVGVLINCLQDAFVLVFIICASVAALFDGVYTLLKFNKWQFTGLSKKLTLIKGIVMALSGIIGIIIPLVATETVVTVVVHIFATMLLYSAVISVENAIVLKKIDKTIPRGHFYIEAVYSIIISIIFFTNPRNILNALVSVIGIAIIVSGVAFIVYSLIKKDNEF